MLAKATNKNRLEQVRSAVLGIRSSGKRYFDEETKRHVLMLHDDGMTIKDIAKELNIAQSVLYAWSKKRNALNAPHVLKIAEVAAEPVDTPASEVKPNIEIRFGSFYLCITKRGW